MTSLTPALLEQMLAGSTEGVLAFDAQCRYTYWNAGMERISGLSSRDVVGQIAFDLFPFLLETGEDGLFRRALAGEESHSRDRPFDVPGTRQRGFYDAVYRPLRDVHGEVIGGFATVRDITERRNAERRLQETEQRFQKMADVAPVMLWMAATDGLCTFFNQTWLDFTGRSMEEEWGVGWAENVHFEDFQRCMDTYLQAFEARQVFEMEYRLKRADGAYRWILDRGRPRFAADGTFAGFIGSCVDITEMKDLEGNLRSAVRVRDEFLSVASHELRTPITALQLQVDRLDRLIRKEASVMVPRERLGVPVQAITSQTARMAELIETLLDVSRITSGRLDFLLEEVDLAELAHDAVARWRAAASAVGSTMDERIEGGIRGRWDRMRLDQVLNNLLSNAVKYGEGQPIHVEAGVDGDAAWLRVRDHGIGIAESDQRRVFDRFERAVSPRNYAGLGLGLWITSEIVEGMQGSISVTSVPGRGAVFTVKIPRSPPEP